MVPKPDTVTFEEGAAAPIAALTALQALHDEGQLQPGQRVLINGASGGVGTFAVLVAKALGALAPEEIWGRRPAHTRDWERMLVDEGTAIVKVFPNVSKEEQRRRFQGRVDDPAKRWKFAKDDLVVRKRFDDYLATWEDVIAKTSTEWAPWHVVPADRKWVKSTAVARLLVETLERLDPRLPELEPGLEGLVIA